jgi:hypothetical protein
MMKNKPKMSKSSVLSMWKVRCGGIKKKFQTSALTVAASKTGPMPMMVDMMETTNSRI